MLTSDLAISYQRGNRIMPRHIDRSDEEYLRVARDLIDLVREHESRSRAELDQALQDYVGTGTDYRILRGLIKLLMDRCLFETPGALDPFEIRRILFFKAKSHHPVIASEESGRQVIEETASQLGRSTEDVLAGLYADLSANQRLTAFSDLSAVELLDGYNLAQAQALLYRAVEMRLTVEPQEVAGFRRLFAAIKSYRLMHTIRGSPSTGYRITLSGPVSIFHRSQKYGVQMAVFLPALLACTGWSMRAEIANRSGRSAFFELNSGETRLPSLDPSESTVQNAIAEKLVAGWSKSGGSWSLEPGKEIINLGDDVFIPDFTLRDENGRVAHLELLGFWTPAYLSERLKQFERPGYRGFILAASEELRGSREAPASLPPNVVLYKSSLSADAVRRAAEEVCGS
ncbi:MAG TPA: DUF790 family protein [Blastocatellia bacterium]|jgi:predicted nuclease of restriction endonuclease-like RecB superfamily|nr:DUF790 family protein [Blastocatellia bacterium]